MGSVWSCCIPAPPLSVCQTSSPSLLPTLLWAANAFISTSTTHQTDEDAYAHTDFHAARVWETCNRHRQTVKQTSQAEQVTTLSTLFLVPVSILFFLSRTRMTRSLSCITYHSVRLREQCTCHRGGCVRVAHIVRGIALCTAVLPRQWSGWRRIEGEARSLKTSGAQLHWLSHQEPHSTLLHSTPLLLFPPAYPLFLHLCLFIETSQLLITAGDSERGCGFWPTHAYTRGRSV